MNGKPASSDRLLLVTAIVILLLVSSVCVIPAQDLAPSVAPPNPKFETYINNLESGRVQDKTEEGYSLGLVPLPVDLPKSVKPRAALQTMALAGIPASFDLRTTGKLTPVRNQGGCGACWSFATCGSLESAMMPSEAWDLSENNLKNYSGFDLNCCAGGNHLMATACLARWTGPLNEASDPYNTSCSSTTVPATVKHVQNVDFLPDRSGPLDNDTIKQSVMTYGAVYTCFYWTSGSHNYSTNAYYYTGAATVNHAVCIVGWDDNYDKSLFATTPPGNGAFLIRNSWGPGWGMGGYLWISYYDANIATYNAMFTAPESATNYTRVYQYDKLGWVQSIGYGNKAAWFANVFTAAASEDLSAVSFYTPISDSTYEVRVYLNPTSGPINSAGPVQIKTGSIASAGYHTVQLSQSIALNAGQRFSAVVKLNTPGFSFPISIESVSPGYSSLATANAGESFLSSNGTTWSDLTETYTNANVCLKAFTTERSNLVVSPSTSLTATGPVGGPFSPYSQVYTLTNVGGTIMDWSVTKGQPWMNISSPGGTLGAGQSTQVAVSLNSIANTLPTGAYTDTLQFVNNSGETGTTSRTVSLTVMDGAMSVSPASGQASSGSPHGPFTPASQTYTLTNTGCGSISWTANNTQPWISLSSVGGSLAPGTSTTVTVSFNSAAENLPAGDYADTVYFRNTTNGVGDVARAVSLSIIPNYSVLSTAFNWIDPSGHTAFALGDDGVTSAQSIPFAFSFYGKPCSEVYIGANGLLGFASSGLDQYTNTDLPNAAAPNAGVYPYWDDLDPSSGGIISIGTEGTAPDRQLVISWSAVPRLRTTYPPLSFQVIIRESTNDIVFQYLEVQPGDLTWGAGKGATVGVENDTGKVASKYSYNGSTLLANNQAMLFTTDLGVGIPDAKRMENTDACIIRNVAVSAAPASDLLYIENDDRSCGIAVYKSQHGMSEGTRVDVAGTVSLNGEGEKCISATSVYPSGLAGAIKPVTMPNAFVGGADWYYEALTGAGQRGVKDSAFLNNIGLLVTTFGRVTYSTEGFFYVDDGSGCDDGSTHAGIKVTGSAPVVQGEDPVGRYVIVTGISSCFRGMSPDTALYRLIRATQVQLAD